MASTTTTTNKKDEVPKKQYSIGFIGSGMMAQAVMVSVMC
jgi:hypothetical protein